MKKNEFLENHEMELYEATPQFLQLIPFISALCNFASRSLVPNNLRYNHESATFIE